MLSMRQVAVRSIKVFGVATAVNALITLLIYLAFGWPLAHEIFGFVALFEAAIFLMAGGFYDWSQAEWGVGFKRLFGNKEARYDAKSHDEADRKGVALVAAGALVFAFELFIELLISFA